MDNSRRGWLISIFCLILILLASANQSFACPPPYCGDCQKWDANVPGCVDDDDQDTTGGEPEEDANDVCGYCQKCSGGECVDDDAAGNADDVCTGPGAECNSCQSGACESGCPTGECCDDDVDVCVSSCPGSECCDSGTCEAPDTEWSPTAGVSVTVDDSIKEEVNNAINSIPCVSGVEVTEVVASISGKMRDCCGDGELQQEVCSEGKLTLSASIGKTKIWGPPTFVEGVDFGMWGASINVEAGVFIKGAFEASGAVGLWTNPCDAGCLYGSASLSTTVTVLGSVTAFGCVKIWGHDYCTPTVSGTVSAGIGFTGTYNFHECGNCSISGDIALDAITASISVTVGSYTGSFNKTIYPTP